MTREEAIMHFKEEAARLKQSVWPPHQDSIDALDMAIAALREQEPVTNRNGLNGWISVEDRLPEDCDTMVLAAVNGSPRSNIELVGAFQLALYDDACGWIIELWPEWENPGVTHWMPLPEPPEEET